MHPEAALLELPGQNTFVPSPHRWTREEVYRLLALGFFSDRRVELFDGEILEMASQTNYHAISIKLGEDALNVAFGPEYWVRVQMSLDLSPFSILGPDLAVIKGNVRGHQNRANPTTALLVVEASDTTLQHDRKRKGSLYARAQILDYWIINIEKGFLEVYRDPGPDESAPFGFAYQKVNFLEKEDTIEPLALPGVKIPVSDLLF